MKTIRWKALAASLAISLGVGVIGGIIVMRGMENGAALYRPPLAPPDIAFPIVWTVLYVLMGLAAYLAYAEGAGDNTCAMRFYFAQLLANTAWTVFFFGWQAYWLSFLELILLWYLILQTIRQFRAIVPAAGWLLYPYLAWVSFAGYLNFAIALHGALA